MYSGSAQLVSFEIKLISEETSWAEPKYMNIHTPISILALALLSNSFTQACICPVTFAKLYTQSF